MRITGIYAAISALIVLILALRVSLGRHSGKVGIGDGGDVVLARRIRVHANATEYLPLALLLLLLLELNQTLPLLLHVFGCVLIVARILHVLGLSSASGLSFGRIAGFTLTLLVVAAMALLLLWQALAVWILT